MQCASGTRLKMCIRDRYTTRPIRENETDGVEYHFVTEEKLEELEKAGKVIELRVYDTVQGIWKYFTADDGKMDLSEAVSYTHLFMGLTTCTMQKVF